MLSKLCTAYNTVSRLPNQPLKEMKLTISKEKLLQGLQAVQSVVGTRTTLPILSNALLRAENDGLELTATDLDLCVSCRVSAKVESKGATTVPVKKLFGLVREISSFELELSSDEKFVTKIKAGPSVFKLKGLPPDEFPPVQSFKEEIKFKIEMKKMKRMLRRTSFAVSSDETRYVLGGVCLNLKGGTLSVVATDGRRLALAEENIEISGGAGESNFILPIKAVNELLRVIKDEGDLRVRLSQTYACFEGETADGAAVSITTKLIDGIYPNFRQVIPTDSKEMARIDRGELLSALRRMEILTSESVNSVKLTFSKNTLSLSVNSPEVGEGSEQMPVVYNGQEFSIAFNPRFIIEPLSVLDCDEIEFYFTDALSPGVIRINEPYVYVVMPMRLTQSTS